MDDHIIMYHGGCPDGFAGAWVLDRFLRSKEVVAELYPCSYHSLPPNIDGKNIYMVDFCYDNLEWMKYLIKESAAFLLLDHHQTGIPLIEENNLLADVIDDAAQFGLYDDITDLSYDLIGVLSPGEKRLVVDQNHSGAVLAGLYTGLLSSPTWDMDEEHEWLYYIEDRDIWKWKLPFAREVTSAIDISDYTIDQYDTLNETTWHTLREMGIAINAYKKQQVDVTVKYAQSLTIAGIKMLGAPSSYSLGSDVAHELAHHSPSGIGVYWVDHPSFRKYGLRSLDDGPNVAEICNLFGGGGHIHAAGFSVPYTVGEVKVPEKESDD